MRHNQKNVPQSQKCATLEKERQTWQNAAQSEECVTLKEEGHTTQ